MATVCFAFLALFSSAAFAIDSGDIVVASTRGEVHFIVNGAERPLRAGSVLELPANIRTGRDGAVELRQGATSISVGPETLLEFPALEKAGGPIDRVVQPKGNAFYNIGKRPGRKLRVETPFLVGVVKGTQFNVAALENSTTISLFEGLLEIRSADETDVVDLHAGEIARRDRGGSDISVLKMDGKVAPEQKPPKSPAGNNSAPSPGPPPAAPMPAPANIEDDVRFVEHDAGPRTVVAAPESVAEANVPARVEVSSEVPAVDVVSNTPAAEAPAAPAIVAAAPDIAVGAGVDVANVDVAVNTPGNPANVDVAVSTPGNGASVDVGVTTPVADVGTNVDLSTPVSGGAAVDVGVETPAANAGVVVNVDNTSSPGADVSVAVETPVGGGGASVDVSVDTPAVNVDVNAGPVNVDLTTGPVTDVVTNVDLGVGDDGNNGLAVGIGNGNGYGNGNANGNGNGNGVVNTVTETVTDVVDTAGSLLDGLLKKPGKK